MKVLLITKLMYKKMCRFQILHGVLRSHLHPANDISCSTAYNQEQRNGTRFTVRIYFDNG